MGKYILKRILWMIPILLAVTILVFTLMYFVPGDIAQIVLGSSATQEQLEAYRELHGLNDPYIVRLGNYLWSILHGDFGTSYVYSSSVLADILERLPRTMIIAFGTVVLGIIVGVPFGILAAVKQDSIADRLILIISLVGASMPSFWLGLMLVIVFALNLGWLPAFGIGGFQYYILPIVANGVAGFASNARLARSSMLEVIRSDYVTTARAKGVSEMKVIFGHALPNALIPIITSAGSTFGMMIGGTMVIESVFSIPGIGMYMTSSISNRDYYAVEGSVIFIAALFSIVMLIVDLLYAFVDPRIKSQYEGGKKRRKKDEQE
ncbi:MAG: ABC transporter permease [Lachnospiraceae bacterium]|nr:ABC transporter permease [Lachnospiraceae bacterium]